MKTLKDAVTRLSKLQTGQAIGLKRRIMDIRNYQGRRDLQPVALGDPVACGREVRTVLAQQSAE